jgi:predicted ATPase
LDRYSASAKSTRSNWFWNKFVSHSSVSPVKGLYLYGGVGTGKTMLMDLFFHQLPASWRTQRIHFHNFMLSVHSRLQVNSQFKALFFKLRLAIIIGLNSLCI